MQTLKQLDAKSNIQWHSSIKTDVAIRLTLEVARRQLLAPALLLAPPVPLLLLTFSPSAAATPSAAADPSSTAAGSVLFKDGHCRLMTQSQLSPISAL